MYFGKNCIKRILNESKNQNVMLMFKTENEALKATREFKEAAGEEATMVGNAMTIRTKEKNIIYFKSVGSIRNGMDGYKAKVIIYVPELEIVSRHDGGVCTMRQFQSGADKGDTDELRQRIRDLESENSRLRNEMSYMVNPNAIGDRHEMGSFNCWIFNTMEHASKHMDD